MNPTTAKPLPDPGPPPWCGRCGAPAQSTCVVPKEQQRSADGTVGGVCSVCFTPLKVNPNESALFLLPFASLERYPRVLDGVAQQLRVQAGKLVV